MLLLLVPVGLATVIGLLVLWPDGEPTRAEQVAATAASIASMQEPCGAVPWTVGEHVDVWNHVEAAMAMLVGGQVSAAERAYAWIPTLQRADGSLPMKIVAGRDFSEAQGRDDRTIPLLSVVGKEQQEAAIRALAQRGVDPAVPFVAAARVAELMV